MKSYVISLDVHCQTTEVTVLTPSGRIRHRDRVATCIPELRAQIEAVPRPRDVVMEEGSLADWLIRNLSPHADAVISCDPRRNALIAKESDKDDPIDSEKLGRLYRGGFVRKVHHAETAERAVFKELTGLYHDRVRNRVRQANRIIGQFRRHGVMVRESIFADPAERKGVLERLPKRVMLRIQFQVLWHGYDAAVEQETVLRRRLVRVARKEPQIRRFCDLPGVMWIRAATIYAYLDTPFRFKRKSSLWKYMGIGLQRRCSGQGPVRLGVPSAVNKPLKNAILGAAMSAVAARSNPFADQYERWIHAGLTPRIARRNVARSLAVTMWGMWKNRSVYRPERVGACEAAMATP